MVNRLRQGHLLLFALTGWINRQQQAAIDYLSEENRVLREQLGGQRLRFSDGHRRRLAAKAKALGRKALDQLATLASPETLLAWHRALIARKWDFSSRRRTPGRPPLTRQIARLIVRLARENPGFYESGLVVKRLPVFFPGAQFGFSDRASVCGSGWGTLDAPCFYSRSLVPATRRGGCSGGA